ncbi:hypothetical protein FRC04_003495 [Tulasnella sp. 424]|nr:hypothetical protein FRC04_003495 [Tulasnella sp. 424]KAG8962156.1 hypothetical protein FRC05_005497 [Tulasnella sp. 425]
MSARARPDGMSRDRLASFQHLNLNHNWLRQPKPRIVLGAVVVCFCFVVFKTISSGGGTHRPYGWTPTESTPSSQEAVELDPSFYVNGSPTSSFRNNLKPGVKYVTTWNYGGLTNELITWINIVHLAYISRRIPVLPPLLPDEEHLGRGGASLDASDIYDIPRLAKTLNLPILEWSQLKRARYYKSYIQADQESHDDDEVLGCWGIYETASEHHEALMGLTPHFLHLNVQYTAALSNISSLANILSPSGRAAALSNSPPTCILRGGSTW